MKMNETYNLNINISNVKPGFCLQAFYSIVILYATIIVTYNITTFFTLFYLIHSFLSKIDLGMVYGTILNNC